jgi:hypothetical protein
VARRALGDDRTYRAAIEPAHPDWDGDSASVVLTHEGMADIVNTIGVDVGTRVRLSIVAACDVE